MASCFTAHQSRDAISSIMLRFGSALLEALSEALSPSFCHSGWGLLTGQDRDPLLQPAEMQTGKALQVLVQKSNCYSYYRE